MPRNLDRRVEITFPVLDPDLQAQIGEIPEIQLADTVSRRLIEKILAKEEEHAEDLKALIETLGHDERATVVILDPCGESFLDAYGAR